MTKEFLGDRKKALEESFFARENAKLLEQLKAEKDTHETREALAKRLGNRKRLKSWKSSARSASIPIPGRRFQSRRWSKSPGRMERSMNAERQAVLSGAEANGISQREPRIPTARELARPPPGWTPTRSLGHLHRGTLRRIGRKRAGIPEATRFSVARAASPRRPVVFWVLGARSLNEEEVILAELAKAFET